MKGPTLLFIDVATSGFEPATCSILEVACMLVSADQNLEVLDTFHAVVFREEEITAPAFHNSLILECLDPCGSAVELSTIEARLLAGPWSRATRLVNRGVDFDRRFLAAHMPTFAKQLPSQTLDVNQIEYTATTFGGVPHAPKSGPRTYRAEDDLVEAYEALRFYSRR